MNPRHAKRNTGYRPIPVLALVLAFVAVTSVFSKSAEDYLHGASYQYVAGKIQEASMEAEEGLRVHPEDARLKTLAEHLRKMKDEQRGNSGQGPGNQDEKKPQDGQDKKSDDGKDQDRDGQNGDRKGEKPDDKNGEPPQGDESSGEADREGRPPQPRAMSEEEAERLLNSFADDEKKEQAERRKAIRSRAGTEQDW